MKNKNQVELFNEFGQVGKTCESCNVVLDKNSEKTGKYWLCGRCRNNYLRNLTIY